MLSHLGRPEARAPRVELAPLIDVVFLVLVAFIEASVFASDRAGVRIDLPTASTSEAPAGAVVEVAIDAEGRYWMGDGRLTEGRLAEVLEARRAAVPSLALLVRADRGAPVGRLVALIDLARAAGIEAATVATTRPTAGEP